ncbi:hypothetical protein [Vibrio coralliilyticus]|uniref:hypothetical protein n=1 Tax=Vibrio coralliilyticus TaxID=190893 RepID=UPI00148C764F|nr:hypothetical protein [Vibrio coralliilyticus]NOI32175.1 hypothetical protein [Vibrio coralliilyticus]NOI51359.1 hypothetical protein [Vibrio coralliilyticus]
MKALLKNTLNIDLDQPSTKKGIALLGAGVALATGHPELITASITAEGVQYGGIIGTTLPIILGFWETIRKEVY